MEWESCRLVDTPGIEGWGPTRSREDLERRAREALVTADVVLLCFDSFNQQAGEFRKVADWLAEFRKPTIAVLNVRQSGWRMPPRAPRRVTRVAFSGTVLEHAGHISEELAAVGLGDTPLVAVNTQRAVYGRVPADFRGPDLQEGAFRALRLRHGPDKLVEWSNLPVLERLLISAIDLGAYRLRRGMLLNQVVGVLDQRADELRATIAQPARDAATQAERGIEQLLAILGAPEAQLDDSPPGDDERQQIETLIERLGELERLRGGGFFAPARGAAQRHGVTVLEAALGPLRAAALRRAEDLVDDAMYARRRVGEEDFTEQVFETDAIGNAVDGAVARLTDYLQNKVGLAADDVAADLRAVDPQGAGVVGAVGRGLQRAAFGTIGVTFALGVAMIWNPVGWGLLIGSTAAGLAAPPLRRWMRRRSVKRRNQESARARAAARQAVADTFDSVRDKTSAWFADQARRAMAVRLTAVVDQAVQLRRIACAAEENTAAVTTLAEQIRAQVSRRDTASEVLREAMRLREDAEVAPGGTRRSLWLGETWCDDPEGLTDAAAATVTEPPPARRPGLGVTVMRRVRAMLAGVTASPAGGSGREWLDQIGQLLDGDAAAESMLADLRTIAAEPWPRVVVYGDYNAGKSSFVKRLLVDDGRPVPPTLKVGARPETATVNRCPWADLMLFDTPGLQSGHATHNEIAHAQLPDAALVVYVLGSTVTGDRTGLDLVLHGEPERGVLPKLDRTLFVVNRSDELGVNPFDDEAGFARLLERRERDLRDALVATPKLRDAGVTVTPERIVFVASDPDGQVGDRRDVTRADFDPFRGWDGFEELRAAVDEFRPRLRANSVDVSILHGGLARLGALAGEARMAADDLRAQIVQLGRLGDDIRTAQGEAALIEQTSRKAVQLGVGPCCQGLSVARMLMLMVAL